MFNILLIEDDIVDVMNVKRAFKECNLTNPLQTAKDGLEGLEILKNNHNKSEQILILLDLNMPRMNGIEFLDALRKDEKLRKHVVVVLTTSNDEKDVIASYNFNVAGYLVKPVEFTNFVKTMSAIGHYWTISTLPNLEVK